MSGHQAPLAILAVFALLASACEAAFLVLAARAALALADGQKTVELSPSIGLSYEGFVAAAAGLIALRLLAGWLTAFISARLVSGVSQSIRLDIVQAYLRSSWATQQSEPPGRIQELLGSFLVQVVRTLEALTSAITSALSLLGLLAISLTVDPLATALVLALVTILAFIIIPLRRAVRRAGRQAAAQGITFASQASEYASLTLEMQVFGVRDRFEERLGAAGAALERSNQRATFLRNLVPTTYTSMAYIAVALALAFASTSDSSSLSALGAVLVIMLRCLSYGQGLQVNVAQIAANQGTLEELFGAVDRFRMDPARTGQAQMVGHSSVDIRHVSFTYPSSGQGLRDISLHIDSGEVIGIVGPSGSGKSTLVQLMLGLRHPESGTITIGECDSRAADRAQWTRRVAFVPQHPRFLTSTIEDNVEFTRTLGRALVEEALEKSYLSQDVATLPNGLDTATGDRASALSGGQQQRLAIARALAGGPDVLILDEPTSALDARSESAIRNTLTDLRGRTTVILIAHRMSTLRMCDRIAVLEGGRLTAVDAPDRLALKSEFFKNALAHERPDAAESDEGPL